MTPKLVEMPEKQPLIPHPELCPLAQCPLEVPFAVAQAEIKTLKEGIAEIKQAVGRIPWVLVGGLGSLVLVFLAGFFALMHK